MESIQVGGRLINLHLTIAQSPHREGSNGHAEQQKYDLFRLDPSVDSSQQFISPGRQRSIDRSNVWPLLLYALAALFSALQGGATLPRFQRLGQVPQMLDALRGIRAPHRPRRHTFTAGASVGALTLEPVTEAVTLYQKHNMRNFNAGFPNCSRV